MNWLRRVVHSLQKNGNTRIVALATLLLVLVSSLLLAWPCRSPDAFIGHADQANLANLAQNIATGKGPVVDTAWLHTNGGIPGGKLPQADPYWSVYAAFLVAPFFHLFGESRLALIMAPLLLRAIIIIICIAIVYAIDRRRLTPALSIGALLSFSPILNDSVNGLSDIYLATATLLSISLMAFAIVRRSPAILFWSGALAGIGVGFKPSGVIIFFAFPILVAAVIKLFPPQQRSRPPLLYLAGGLLGISLYFTYNVTNFGSLAPPGYKIIDKEAVTITRTLYKAQMTGRDKTSDGKPIEIAGASMKDMDFTLFAQYNPKASTAALPQQLLDRDEKAKRPLHNLIAFLTNLSQGNLIPLWLFPFIAAGILTLLLRVKQSSWFNLSTIEWFLVCALSILFGGIALALRIHFTARYWLLCMPFLLIFAFFGIKKTTLHPALYSLSLVLLSLPWSGEWYGRYSKYECQAQSPAYQKIKTLLPANAIVMTTNPWQFSFHTRRRSIVTPYTVDQRIIGEMADRYGVKYLAVVKSDTTQEYPRFRRLLEQGKLPIFDRIYNDNDLDLYSVKSSSLRPRR